ncbi:MAG: alpha/beta hydrolase [Dyella sp.]|nr:alpha/beta hydrolase [Dyella sp.]
MRKLFAIAFAVAVSHGALADTPGKAPLVTDPVYAAPVRLVDIGDGQRLNLYCLGAGSPAVILDAGMGDSTISWALVQKTISNQTQVCSFDRAGLGFSDAARRSSTPRNQSEDLHALLKAAHVRPPYVLVAHSMAGMNARVYADMYPEQVAGMVLVEGSHEDQSVRGWAIGDPGQQARYDAFLKDRHGCIDEAKKGLVEGTDAFKKCVGDTYDPRFSKAINEAQEKYAITEKWQSAVASERENVFYTSADETRGTRKSFGDMPLIVLTHSPFPKGKDESQDIRNQRTLLWEDMHTQVASMSTRGINVIVPNSTHYIQYEHPQIVVDAVMQAVDISRKK